MAQISKSAASLRIMGDELAPSDVTKILGCAPSFEQTKGQEIVNAKTGNKRLAISGMWRLDTNRCEPENLDAQISKIFNQLTNDLTKWKSLNDRYDIDLFCGIFMKEEMEGMEVSPVTLKILGERGVTLGLEIYCPDENAL